MRPLRIAGEVFGRLTVVEVDESTKGSNQRKWKCRCSCGGTVSVTSTRLVSGDTRSCGCLKKETAALQGRRNATHGMSGSPTYRSWMSMIHRCRDRKHKSYPYYGARGVEVAAEWGRFSGFLSDMGERPPNTTLDRIDPDGHYCKENCRWADESTQANNRTNSVRVKALGVSMTVSQWARRSGISKQALRYRLQAGWPPEKAVTLPTKPRKKPLKTPS